MWDFGCSENFEVKKNVRVVCYPVSWAPCCKTWLGLKDKMEIAVGNKKNDCLFCRKKIDENFSKYCSGRGLCLTHVGAPCCKTWLKFEVNLRVFEKKNEIRDFCLLGSNPLVGRHVVKHGWD